MAQTLTIAGKYRKPAEKIGIKTLIKAIQKKKLKGYRLDWHFFATFNRRQ
jgi:hypothetical protein